MLTNVPGSVLSALRILTHLILITTLGGRSYDEPHFTDEAIGTGRLNNSPKIIRLQNGEFKPLSRAEMTSLARKRNLS